METNCFDAFVGHAIVKLRCASTQIGSWTALELSAVTRKSVKNVFSLEIDHRTLGLAQYSIVLNRPMLNLYLNSAASLRCHIEALQVKCLHLDTSQPV